MKFYFQNLPVWLFQGNQSSSFSELKHFVFRTCRWSDPWILTETPKHSSKRTKWQSFFASIRNLLTKEGLSSNQNAICKFTAFAILQSKNFSLKIRGGFQTSISWQRLDLDRGCQSRRQYPAQIAPARNWPCKRSFKSLLGSVGTLITQRRIISMHVFHTAGSTIYFYHWYISLHLRSVKKKKTCINPPS